MLIVGDFNFKEIRWDVFDTSVNEDHVASIFFESIKDTYLIQHIKENTRYRSGNQPSLLDLILTNEEDMVSDLEYLPGLGKSDHVSLTFTYNCFIEAAFNNFKKLNFHKGDFKGYETEKEAIDGDAELADLNLVESWNSFAETNIKLLEKFIPVSKVGNASSKGNRYLSTSCIEAIRVKHRKWKRYKY